MADEFETPRCDKCGFEVTTGAMALICPHMTACPFWTPEIEAFKELQQQENDHA